MATLRAIRERLRAAENIKQITRIMEMVAAARLHQAQPKAESILFYHAKMKEILDQILSSATDIVHPLLKPKKNIKKTIVIIVSSDRGHCGGYNSHLLSVANQFLANYTPEAIELVLFGQKAINYFQHKKWPIYRAISHWGGKITEGEIRELASQFIDQYVSDDLDEVWLIYTHFISVFQRQVTTEKFLNIPRPSKVITTQDYILEPSPQEICDELLPMYCTHKLQTMLDDAYAAELAARVISMKTATKNAEEMIDSLTLLRNKVRQASITREMIEITQGAL